MNDINVLVIMVSISLFILLLLSLFLLTLKTKQNVSNVLFATFLIIIAIDFSGVLLGFEV